MINNFYNDTFYNNKLLTKNSTKIIKKIRGDDNIKRLFPNNSSYRIEDGNVVLEYKDINYDFYTNQDQSMITLYTRRYEDLFSCCFNKSMVDLFNKDGSLNKKIELGIVNCDELTENDCLFFQRFYCRAIKDLLPDSNLSDVCSCYEFLPRDRVLLKLGIPNSCLNNKCNAFVKSSKNNIFDDSVMTNSCNLDVCSNLIQLSNLNVDGNINITSDTLNLVCNENNN
jgi:hypothetical protein